MRLRNRIRTVLTCLMLEAGALMGAPVRMEELEKLLRSLAEPQVAQTHREENPNGDPPRGKLEA